MSYITRRGAAYYLNLRLPKHLYPDRTTLRLSLGVRDRQTAVIIASELARRVHEHISSHPLTEPRKLLALCAEWRTSTPVPTITASPAKTSTKRVSKATDGPTLASLAKLYIEEGKRSSVWRTVSTLDVERALRDFFELMGDMPALSFGMEQSRILKERLARCPQYFAQRPEFKGMTLRQVVDSTMTYQTITAVTINNRLRKLTAFFNWCKANGYIEQNPLTGMKVMAGAAKDARLSFEPSELRTLLNRETLANVARKHPWRYWLPLLARFTGARLEELCQLHVDDVTTVQGIPCIRFDDSRKGQQLKNQSSRRILPIHHELLSLGLLEHVEAVRAADHSRLFPDLEATRDKYGHAPSKWFGRYKVKLGINDPRKAFHSFRHTFIDDLREAGVQDSLVKRMVGHEDGSVTFGVYGSRLPLKAMLDAITSIQCLEPSSPQN
ncbi:site-specific integrase [Metapseudomonas resinovorans]|uniref:Putative phage integrase n=1 Tax=Metapseudomonas resinovorans NBRC 106553 TaxID=1245471 RepID=S6ADX4_METRE|nr:site-specific integrase [Pseudomonas resinovorans]BAN47682.1 putative phage integrase [Pseudomonas resinovorans NBRC 106553]